MLQSAFKQSCGRELWQNLRLQHSLGTHLRRHWRPETDSQSRGNNTEIIFETPQCYRDLDEDLNCCDIQVPVYTHSPPTQPTHKGVGGRRGSHNCLSLRSLVRILDWSSKKLLTAPCLPPCLLNNIRQHLVGVSVRFFGEFLGGMF